MTVHTIHDENQKNLTTFRIDAKLKGVDVNNLGSILYDLDAMKIIDPTIKTSKRIETLSPNCVVDFFEM